MTPGQLFLQALQNERPLQLPGVINAYAALLAQDAGFHALYLSGAGVANASYGLPDLGHTTLHHVLEDTKRITAASDLPLFVDADTGWENPAKTIAALESAGAAGCHLEDQTEEKRCGHRPNKQVVSTEQMCDRLKAATDGRTDQNFVLMARTDAVAPEGLPAAIDRCHAYLAAGADMIFCEALDSLHDYRTVTATLNAPVLANITEFGKTPLFTREELYDAGLAIALYPLSAFRAMSKAAMDVYQTLRNDGTQQSSIDQMQTREELYKHLRYHEQEEIQDSTHGTNQSS